MEPIPVVKEKRGISPVWTLPIIALCICAWIIYSSHTNAEISITIYFEDASGIIPGKTQIIARGVPIGMVTKIIPDIGNRRIKTIVKMDQSVENQLVQDTVFWIVRPEISAASVKGLDTLFSGSYIGIQPGSSTVSTREYIGLTSPPPISMDTPGLHIKLSAEGMDSLKIGSEVYYRNIAIGSVTKSSLNREDDTVIINIFVKPEYAHLVKEGSRFSNASGMTISGKLTNLKVHFESLSALLKGGIVLHTPSPLMETNPVENGHTFPLFKDIESARYGIKMTLQLASSIGITEGETQVIYRGLVAGVVEKIEFNDDERHTVTAHIMLDPKAERILREGTQFWIVKPEISTQKIENLDTLITGSYITFLPGTGEHQDHFEILPEPPPHKPLRPGKEYLLKSPESYSIQKGAPVYYKNKKVGEVVNIELHKNFKDFEITIFIYKQYEQFVQPHSVFWSEGGVTIDASLSGIKLQTNSLSAAFIGGISFITPDQPEKVRSQKDAKKTYQVYENFEKAVAASPWMRPPGYRFRLKTDNPGPFKTGTPIFFKNIQVGKITGFNLSKDNSHVLIDCMIEKTYEDTVNSSSRFYDVSGISIEGGLSGMQIEADSLQSIVSGGLAYFTPKSQAQRKKNATYSLYTNKEAAETIDSVSVSVRFKKCDNLRKGSSVKYKGVEIGQVAKLDFAEDMSDIIVHLNIHQKAESFFRSDTKIWLEQADVSLSGIKNLKTVLSGPFINIQPGNGELTRTFNALTAPPFTPQETRGGLHVILISKHLGSIKIKSPVYYRQVKIGQVVSYSLSDDFKNVHIEINIEAPYIPIIRENTKFWIASGAKIEGGLFSGVSVSMESVESLLTGGIALATPDNSKMGEQVEDNHLFKLHERVKEEWLDWQPSIILVEKDKK